MCCEDLTPDAHTLFNHCLKWSLPLCSPVSCAEMSSLQIAGSRDPFGSWGQAATSAEGRLEIKEGLPWCLLPIQMQELGPLGRGRLQLSLPLLYQPCLG